MFKTPELAMVMAAVAAVALCAFAKPAARYEVTTWSGQVYVIGEGSTCNAAWEGHSALPDDWRSIECIAD